MRRLLELSDCGVDGIKMVKRTAERDVRAAAGDETALTEAALRTLYARKAFREVGGVDEERLGLPPPPAPPHEHPHPPPHRPRPSTGRR